MGWRVVVVGGGVIGLLTALECVVAGAEVVLVDASELPNPRGASYDRHRIIRSLHPGDAPATRAAAASRRRWLRLEERLGAAFFRSTGVLSVMEARHTAAALTMLSEAGVAAIFMGADELARRLGHLAFEPGAAGVLEARAGVVLADRALAALVRWLDQTRRVRWLRRRVVSLDTRGPAVRLADGTRLAGDRVVVAAGPWSRELLPAALASGLTLQRQSLLYCRVPGQLAAAWSATPVVLGLGPTRDAWLVPPVGQAPMKLSATSACRGVASMAGHLAPTAWRDLLVDRLRELVPGAQPAWVMAARDGYYLSYPASGGPMLAELGRGAVWAYAACGGSSFKFAPLIARSLAQRALGTPPTPTGLVVLDRPHAFDSAMEESHAPQLV